MFIRIFLGGLGPLTSPAVWFLACFVSSTWFSLPVDFSPQLEASFVMVFRTTSTLTATALLVLFAEQCSGMKILVDQSAANADAVAACYSGPEQDVLGTGYGEAGQGATQPHLNKRC